MQLVLHQDPFSSFIKTIYMITPCCSWICEPSDVNITGFYADFL